MILLSAALINVSHAGVMRDWWSGFCERHLIASDPWQYRSLSVEQLLELYWRHRVERFESRALINEMRFRLEIERDRDLRELLTKALAHEVRQ